MNSITQEMLDAVLAHLKANFGKALAVEFFPDAPQSYRLNHPAGAVLLMFAGSRFGQSQSLDRIVQPREITFAVTLVTKRLNGAKGAVPVLDALRAALVGFKPPHCQMGLAASGESFVGQAGGLWNYRQEYMTQSMQVEVLPADVGLPLVSADFEEDES